MQGIILAIAAYAIWGGFPLFFHYLSHLSALEVLTHRIIWSCLATGIIALLIGRRRVFRQILSNTQILGWLAISSVLIAINWLIYIWAVSQQQVLEASLGYFITPVLSLILARLVLKETLHPLQAIAGVIALLAIVWELISLGRLPWIGLALSVAFALYGLIRKMHPVDGITGLTVETLLLLPLALSWIIWQTAFGSVALGFPDNDHNQLLLIASGLLTALPLVLFAMAARRSDLSIIGFIMYLNPTIQFLIGLFVLKEAVPDERLMTFLLIWIAMMFFIIGMWRQHKIIVHEYKST